eukprot:SAG31_NODE_1576_length_7838_cov_5.738468_2_plen_106_part_00
MAATTGVILSDEEFGHLMRKIDSDGGGSIDYNEFAQHLKDDDVQRSMMPSDAPFANQHPDKPLARVDQQHAKGTIHHGVYNFGRVEADTHKDRVVENKSESLPCP